MPSLRTAARSAAPLLLVVALTACGGATSHPGGTGGTGATGGAGPGGVDSGIAGTGGRPGRPGAACFGLTVPGADGGTDALADGGQDAGSPAGPAAACTGVAHEAHAVPLGMLMMLDRSVSMETLVPDGSQTRWQAVTRAISDFVADPQAAGMSLGLDLFPVSDVANDPRDCELTPYEAPSVPVDLLPDVGAAVNQALLASYPGGFTPTLPALQGALNHMKAWGAAHADRAPLVVLVSDGYPTQCQDTNSISEIAAVAAQAFATEPRVRTFVIGIGGVGNLDQIAERGGTGSAFILEQGDVAADFTRALLSITDASLSCEYELPPAPSPAQMLALDHVQLIYTAAGGASEEVPKVSSVEDCTRTANGGWYYDDPITPTKIQVCPCTCARLAEAGRVDISVGCRPSIGIVE